MESNTSKVRLHRDGLIANDIHLVIKKWIINQKDISMIVSDTTTVFASLRNVVGSKDTNQCRKLLGLNDNVDLAMIFIITMCNTRFIDKQVVTNWIGSDLQESSVKIVIRGELTPELKDVGVGCVCAILNPNMKEQVIASDLKSITIKQLDDILVIGQLDGLTSCKGVTSKGEMCKNLVYVHNQGDYCKYHVKFSNHKSGQGTRASKGSKNTGNNPNKGSAANLNKRDRDAMNAANSDSNFLAAKLGERTYVELSKPYTLVERPKPAKQSETIAKLGDLNFLMQKIINNRTTLNVPSAPTNASATANAAPQNSQPTNNQKVNNEPINGQKVPNQPVKQAPNKEPNKEFERLTSLIKQYITKDSKEYNNILSTLQSMAMRLSGVSNDIIKRTQIIKTCDFLLDHPSENIAVTALRLRRTIKKYVKTPTKDGEYVITRPNTGIVNDNPNINQAPSNVLKGLDKGDNNSTNTPIKPKTKQSILNELDSLINLSSNVDSIVDKEKGIELTEKLKTIEKLDKTEEFKLTIKFIEVQAYYCVECNMWFEHVNNYCNREKHQLIKKKVKKEYHICINKPCSYRYYSLNGQKPSRCPKCKQTTVVSEKTSFYKARPNYLMPNETLIESEAFKSRPLNCDS